MKKIWKSGTARSLAVVVAQLALMATAHADLIEMGNRGIDLVKVGTQLFVAAAVLIGVASVIYAFSLMRKKAGERGEDVTAARIFLALFGGCGLIVIGFVIGAVTETFGAGAGDIGKNLF
ncbi:MULTISPECIES: DUF6750 family protein [Achromobacter]|uniref:Uncharacterized protein n=1 Tax=Achromobacter xylosoxidans (strain A8) TaxID=762376 RepID=E3HYD1_ACHXA|nr:DUF6750 family protein [Achromobacter xylosoxidans]ADP20085.1 hypothetical protein AXYL_06803 [Achromobacter xylosoxidans A8]